MERARRPQSRSSQRLSGSVSSRELALRTHPLVFGMVLFLASDLMLFGGFIAAYFNLKNLADAWPPAGVRLDGFSAAIGTAMLAASSASMLFVTHHLARNRFALARLWLGGTILLGTAFVMLEVRDWATRPFRIDSHAYGSLFFVMTGFHALHVSAGILMLVSLFFGIRMAAFERDNRAAVEAIGFYWHFVFLVWVMVWGALYVVR